MSLIVIVGAGSGMGLAIARVFGQEGFAVALVARNRTKLDSLTALLADEGIDATGFTADLLVPESITEAFAQIRTTLGDVDVLEFSAADATLPAADVLDVTPANLQPQLDFYFSAIHVVRQVVDEMIAAKTGTIIVTTGGGSVDPTPSFANISIASAGLRNWVLNLHNVLAKHGVYAAHLAISAWIGSGQPGTSAAEIAPTYLDLHETRVDADARYPSALT
ncbi:short-chain dehydrogenase [Rhodococcoides trifolii]|uniref:Short-chain dehydrogenase n=1 Tax=Rhodococcoides trifolii TaxID=908250 RepID=A0A917G7R5_9NOCA|nr:SDR family NAD(P)-dependent oxidoreductase [Rhodococcus trifolii]GGG26237.1 short-chain dehydrogenase [Rhodococcus trifolii]